MIRGSPAFASQRFGVAGLFAIRGSRFGSAR